MRRKWTDEEIQFLKFAYHNKDFTSKDIVIALSRSYPSILAKAKRLGLKRYKEVLDNDLKRCTKCKTIYKKEFFGKSDNGRLHSWCRNCLNERWHERYNSNAIIKNVDVGPNGVGANGVETKKCFKCKEVKKTSEFNKNKFKKDGLNAYCRICQNKANEECRLKKLKERGW